MYSNKVKTFQGKLIFHYKVQVLKQLVIKATLRVIRATACWTEF